MSAQPLYQELHKPLRCFDVCIDPATLMPSWFIAWRKLFLNNKSMLSHRHEEALARLIPLLLCGEQSAIHVFGEEIERLQGSPWSNSVSLLKEIETDEYTHEQALQTVSSVLMEPVDIHSIKRKARHFYLGLGATSGMIEHFARISELDTCVCIIMNAITHSALGSRHLITQLFERIKQDEARHVYVCRKHYTLLGGERSLLKQGKSSVSKKLVSLLKTEANSFEMLGVDPDALFYKLVRI